MARLHQIGARLHVPVEQSIDTALTSDPELDLLGPFAADESDVEVICVSKTIYLPTPFVGVFLERNLTPVEAWSCLRGAIVDAGSTVYCCLVIDWLRFSLTRKSKYDQPSPLAMS